MSIPEDFQSSKYPDALDNNQNLFLVHDALRVVLAEDYNPADDIVANRTKITISGDISLFPDNGIITLTEQCNDIEDRAISFYYMSKTETTFEGLVVLDGFDNTIIRPKKITNVLQNVMAEHHNSLKDALIAIETFAGVKGTVDTAPFGDTIEGRINFLQKLILTPRAWFTANQRVGLIPLEVTFKNESFRMGDGDVVITWDFGDADSAVPISSISTISVTDVVPISSTNVYVVDIDSGTVKKTYTSPNKYTVKLHVENEFGSDEVIFEDFINARVEAPIEAIIEFAATSSQIATAGSPTIGPYTTSYPKIRSKINRFIDMIIPDGIHPTTLRTYGGEEVDGSTPIDPIDTYTWSLSDDLDHPNQKTARASYSIGGLYDLVLRCDTRYGAYRISSYPSVIDIVEDKNIWLFTTDDTEATSNEFGLISETFKTGDVPYTLLRDSSFLTGTNNEDQALREFNRNTAFTINGTVDSGNQGLALLLYAGGGDGSSVLGDHQVRVVEFEGFSGSISDNAISIYRPWNWVYFAFGSKSYFLLGPDADADPNENIVSTTKDILDLGVSLSLASPVTLNASNFLNGAGELLENVTSDYDMSGEPSNGRFSVYRSTKKDSTGYIIRNDSVGDFFKLKEFYRTEGVSSDPVLNIRKLPDMPQIKTEGQLVSLNNGIYFFNNSGSISAYNTTDQVWETATVTSPFKNFQDTLVDGYDDTANSLLAVSDNERNAYLSYDYSSNAFIKYNSVDFTFSMIGNRPDGDQWIMGLY